MGLVSFDAYAHRLFFSARLVNLLISILTKSTVYQVITCQILTELPQFSNC